LSSAPFFHSSAVPTCLHSFPTRRSSDLKLLQSVRAVPARPRGAGQQELSVRGVHRARVAARDVLPRSLDRHREAHAQPGLAVGVDRKSTRLNSSHVKISYAVFCLKKKKK